MLLDLSKIPSYGLSIIKRIMDIYYAHNVPKYIEEAFNAIIDGHDKIDNKIGKIKVFDYNYKKKNIKVTFETDENSEQLELLSNEMLKTKNRISVLEKALNKICCLSGDKPFDENLIDDTWFMHYCDCIGNVTQDEAKEIWASILVGQCEGSNFSLRALNTIKLMSNDEAILFNKIKKKSLIINKNERCIFEFDQNSDFYDCGFSELGNLEEIGLISVFGNMAHFSIEPGRIMLLINNKNCITLKNNDSKEHDVNIIQFTKLGMQIASLDEGDDYYFSKEEIETIFRSKNKIEISLIENALDK